MPGRIAALVCRHSEGCVIYICSTAGASYGQGLCASVAAIQAVCTFSGFAAVPNDAACDRAAYWPGLHRFDVGITGRCITVQHAHDSWGHGGARAALVVEHGCGVWRAQHCLLHSKWVHDELGVELAGSTESRRTPP